MAEIIMKRPLFPGSSDLDQLQKIFAIRGTPDQDKTWKNVIVLSGYKLFTSTEETPWKDLFPNEPDTFLDLLDKML